MKARILARPHADHQVGWGGAFAEGLRRHGWETEIATDWAPCDLLVIWGVRRQADIARQRDRGDVCVLERGYLGDRFQWTSVSFGGELNGRAEFRGLRGDPIRFQRNFGHLMQPWRRQDGYALILGQVPNDMSLQHVGGRLGGWYRETAELLRNNGMDVCFRPHPKAAPQKVGLPVVGGSLADALAGASLAVSFNSNSAVDAVLTGVPAVACDVGSMAWPVTTHDPVAPPERQIRDKWAAQLAWCQWSDGEMRSGECWEACGKVETCSLRS